MIADLIPKLAATFQDQGDYHPRPSLAGPERCIRSLVYWGLGVAPAPLPGRTLIVFDDSSWHEELTLDWLRKSAYQVHSQQMAVNIYFPMGEGPDEIALHLTGHIDGILTDPLHRDTLLEHKAINHFTWERWAGAKSGLPLDYMTQLALYLRGLHGINPDLTSGLLLMKNKNTGGYLEYRCDYLYEDDTLAVKDLTAHTGECVKIGVDLPGVCRTACDKFRLVAKHIKEKRLPTRPYPMDDWHCQYCSWAGTCWENYHQEFLALSDDAALSDEIATAAGYYKQLGGQISGLEKERELVKLSILNHLRDLNARKGRAGDWVIELRQQHKDGFVSPPKDYLQLYVNKIKEEKTSDVQK